MIYNFKINNKIINIYYNKFSKAHLVILNSFNENGEKIFNLTHNKEYILVTISNINWNSEMTPWKEKSVFKGEKDYEGKADRYILELEENIIPKIKDIIINELKIEIISITLAGYSLAGLFSIYSIYKTNIFDNIISCSGSLWYPKFINYINSNSISRKPNIIYLSLGNKERNTKNIIMSKVEDNTTLIKEYFKSLGINVIYEINDGNHFQDVEKRISKAIDKVLEKYK